MHRSFHVTAFKAQPQERLFHLGVYGMSPLYFKLLIGIGQLLDKCQVRFRFIVGPLSQFGSYGIDPFFKGQHRCKRIQRLPVKGFALLVLHLLRKVSHFGSPTFHDPPLIRLLPPVNEIQDGGLACPVTPHQPDTISRIDLETDLVEEHLGPESYGYIINGYHSGGKNRTIHRVSCIIIQFKLISET